MKKPESLHAAIRVNRHHPPHEESVSTLWHRFGIALTGIVLLGLYLPKLLTIGTFTDGLVYAVLARNLAIGNGSWWTLRYGEADSFWIEGVRGDMFYDHPPLMMILESLFFRLLGDHWWVEELFSGLTAVVLGWLIIRLWTVLRPEPSQRSFGWLILLAIGSIPFVCLSVSNNYLDGFLLVLVVFSFYQLCRLLLHRQSSGLYWAGVGIFLGFLTKGPFNLFLLGVPVLYGLTHGADRTTLYRAIRQTVALTAVFAGLLGLLLLYSPARDFFEHYVQQQLLKSLQGTRPDQGDVAFTRLGRFYIVVESIRNLSRLFLVSVVGWAFVRWQIGRIEPLSTAQRRLIVWLVWIGLTGLLPIMASVKQNPWYIVPSAPFFALAVVTWQADYLRQWLATGPALPPLWIRVSVLAGLTIVFVTAFTRFHALTATTPAQRRGVREIMSMQRVPPGSVVGVTDRSFILGDVILNTSLQRFRRIALTMDTTRTAYRLSRLRRPMPDAANYEVVETLPGLGVQFSRRK